jgi:hypothetical protein
MPLPPNSEAFLKIAIELCDGDLAQTDLTCPSCGASPLAFSFTTFKPHRYGLIILCKNCQHKVHLTISKRPKNFRDDLILPEFQLVEDRANHLQLTNKTTKLGAYRLWIGLKNRIKK